MITSFQIVDEFLDDPGPIRQSAFDSGFGTWMPNRGLVGSSRYSGMNFYGNHAPVLHKLARAVGSAIFPNAMFFRVTNKDTEKAYIHSDRTAGNHTCITYLSKHEAVTGTAFWRHKKLDLSYMPPFSVQQEKGIFDQLKGDMVNGDTDTWEQLDFVRSVFNRALLFQAPLFHSRWPLDGFADGEEAGRLVHVTHFFKLDATGALY